MWNSSYTLSVSKASSISGTKSLPVYSKLYKRSVSATYFALAAAMGYAKQKRRKQIYACTSSVGPGAANMVTAAATATANCIPVLFLPGDVYATRQPDPVLQQMEQPHDLSISTNDAFRAVSKYWDRITRPEQLMSACINAMRVLTDPADTGAVTIALPQDVEGEAYDYPEYFFQKRVHRVDRRPATKAIPLLLNTSPIKFNACSQLPPFLGLPLNATTFIFITLQ